MSDSKGIQSARRLALGHLRHIACLGAIAMLLAGCRLDMHVQPKYLP